MNRYYNPIECWHSLTLINRGFIIKYLLIPSARIAAFLIATICLLLPQLCRAENLEKLEAQTQPSSNTQALPFGFFSDSMGTALGLGAISTGTIQPQASLFGLGVYSSNNSWMYYVAALNFQIPQVDQWLFSLDAYNA